MAEDSSEDLFGCLKIGLLILVGLLVLGVLNEYVFQPIFRVVWAIAEGISTLMYYALIIGVPAFLIYIFFANIWRKMNE